jgi:hypothetical protein
VLRSRRREVLKRRRQGWTKRRIAQSYALAVSMVITELRPLEISWLRSLEPPCPDLSDEYAQPGDLVHIDLKKLGRIGAAASAA